MASPVFMQYRVVHRKFKKYVIKVAIPAPISSNSKKLMKSQHQPKCSVEVMIIVYITTSALSSEFRYYLVASN